jgi:CBS domain-containing protein
MLVQHILAQKPNAVIQTITPDKTVGDAAKLLAEKRIGALIVTRDGKTIDGILSERDIVRELGKRGVASLDDSVSAIMTNAVIGCHPGDTAVSVLEKMTDGRFRHMPVLDQGRMVGVISIGDVVKARIGEVESENSALAEMIAGH